jgi:hypothetical protein
MRLVIIIGGGRVGTAADAPPAVLVAQTVGMLLGRLELLVVVGAVARLTRDGVEVGKVVTGRHGSSRRAACAPGGAVSARPGETHAHRRRR